MIRIDEIYSSVFQPWLRQNRPGVRMIWFDPFGTTGIENLQNGNELYACEHNYILFFDQEPIDIDRHKAVFQHVKDNNVSFAPEKSILVTSEYESNSVEAICQNFNWNSRYYFFHGWASLDWFRGYNNSYLIVPPSERKITHTFLCPMRIIGGQRSHRVIMMSYLVRFGLHHNHISFPRYCPVEKQDWGEIAHSLEPVCPGIVESFTNHKADNLFPRQFKNEHDHPMRSYQLDLFTESAESLVYLVSETVADGKRCHLTEKVFKPICLGMPFVLLSTVNSLQYLKKYGFKTFNEFWDESYDTEVSMVRRIEKIAHVLHALDRLTLKQKNDLWQNLVPIVEYNYQHFYNGGFEKVLKQELDILLTSV